MLPAAALAWCASAFGQVPPTSAEYAQYRGLFAAAARNDTARIVKLIAGGEYAGMRDSHGRTPLHVAAYKRRHDAMRVLAAATGDPNVLDADGYDIATIAARRSRDAARCARHRLQPANDHGAGSKHGTHRRCEAWERAVGASAAARRGAGRSCRRGR